MSVFFVMLGIPIESYEHVLGSPGVSLDSEKNIYGLNGKFQNLIKE